MGFVRTFAFWWLEHTQPLHLKLNRLRMRGCAELVAWKALSPCTFRETSLCEFQVLCGSPQGCSA